MSKLEKLLENLDSNLRDKQTILKEMSFKDDEDAMVIFKFERDGLLSITQKSYDGENDKKIFLSYSTVSKFKDWLEGMLR